MTNRDWAIKTREKIREKMSWVSVKNCNKIVYTTDSNGDYDDRADSAVKWNVDDGINWWTNGFWSGLMWLLYQDTKEDKYQNIARQAEYKLEKCFNEFYGIHHDVGFMFQPAAVTDYRLTGNEYSRKIAMHAANLLAGRFNPAGRFIRAWNELEDYDTRGWAIIDCMLNLSLLYWASEESQDPRYKQIAMMHADTVMESFVRPDGSVCHIVEFDPQTGEMVQSHRGQGYAEGSSWTRGQGWALYGFIISYIHTNKQEYLDTAKKVAHYCIANLNQDGLIPVDYRQPKEPVLEDSCAACIIAGGLLEVAGQVPELERDLYENAAVKILKTIDEKRADWTKENDSIVQNCTGAYHQKDSVHMTMVYADYYFAEAIYKLLDEGIFIW